MSVERLLYFIAERERIRLRKEAGEPPPWTDNSTLRQWSFCNVERERDRVTRWIAEHWREPHRNDPDVWFAMVVARFINAPEVLGEITLPLPWDRARYLAEMTDRKARGQPLERSAYTIPAPKGFASKFEGLAECVFEPLWSARAHIRPRPDDTCAAFFERLQAFDYLGEFLAAQVVADTKFAPPLCDASDVMTFARPGPGSLRGLSRVLGRPVDAPWTVATWLAAFHKLRAELTPQIEQILGRPLSASDLQNVLCETDKLLRVELGEGTPRRRYGSASEARKARPVSRSKTEIPVEPALPVVPHAIPELAARRDPNAAHVLHYDFETRSACDLLTAGAWRYAADPSTEVLCCAFAVDDEPVQLWTPGDPIPPEFIEAEASSNWLIASHNNQFELAIETHVLQPRFSWPLVPLERRRCSMAAALASALPGSLEGAAAAFALPHRKDADGHRIMMQMAKPHKGGGWIDDPGRRERLHRYCIRDVEAERGLFHALPPLSIDEQMLWMLDAEINARGFYVDVELTKNARELVRREQTAIKSRVLAWFAGEAWKLNGYREFDRTADPTLEPYCVTASRILRRAVTPDDEAGRAIGKTADLALGFGGALGAWRRFDPDGDHSDEEVAGFVQRWRQAHPATTRFWRLLESAAKRAVRTGERGTLGNLAFEFERGTLHIVLPSGRRISYPQARLAPGKFNGTTRIVFKDNARGGWSDKEDAWHGVFVENLVQGTARDLLAAAMRRLEAARYPIVLHIHDEIIVEVPTDRADADEFHRLTIEPPSWAAGLPIAAKVRVGDRYSKSKSEPRSEAPTPETSTANADTDEKIYVDDF
jgi:5-hmdU DNA kinase, helical domain